MSKPEGTLTGIFIAANAEAPMLSVSEVRAVPGRGLDGDRYSRAAGTFSKGHEPDSELTLIESEAVEALAREQSLALQPSDSRRNLVTRGVALNDLVGCEFMIGEVRVLGHGLCEPCRHLVRLTGQGAISRASLTAEDSGHRFSSKEHCASETRFGRIEEVLAGKEGCGDSKTSGGGQEARRRPDALVGERRRGIGLAGPCLRVQGDCASYRARRPAVTRRDGDGCRIDHAGVTDAGLPEPETAPGDLRAGSTVVDSAMDY